MPNCSWSWTPALDFGRSSLIARVLNFVHSTGPHLEDTCSNDLHLVSHLLKMYFKQSCPKCLNIGVEVKVDDLLIWDETKEQHNTRLKKVLQCAARQRNLKLNNENCQIKLNQISYVGRAEIRQPESQGIVNMTTNWQGRTTKIHWNGNIPQVAAPLS